MLLILYYTLKCMGKYCVCIVNINSLHSKSYYRHKVFTLWTILYQNKNVVFIVFLCQKLLSQACTPDLKDLGLVLLSNPRSLKHKILKIFFIFLNFFIFKKIIINFPRNTSNMLVLFKTCTFQNDVTKNLVFLYKN